jgi:tetratricopeptide (TPR) repeat protein
MSRAMSEELLEQARSRFEGGEFRRCWELAREGLAENPDDPALLRLVGRAGLELDDGGALDYLQKAAEAAPDDAEIWRDLAEALVLEGRAREAVEALQRAVQLRPDDAGALVDLAHIAHATGDAQAAIGSLEQVVERDPTNAGALRSLTEMYRDAGRREDALATAGRLAAATPGDPLAMLTFAELSLELERLDDAAESFRRLREIDDEPEHAVYAYHGLIETELRRERFRTALDLAVDATRVDRLGRTTDVLAYIVSQVFGTSAARPAPPRAAVDEALADSRTEHRQLHAAHVL